MENPTPKNVLRVIKLAGDLSPATVAIETVRLGSGFSATTNGLAIDGEPSYKAWVQSIRKARTVERVGRSAPFVIGDAINYGEQAYGEKASQELSPENGWALETIKVYSWLAGRIAPERRRMDRLGVRHHLLVATLSPEKQTMWLTRAAGDGEEQPAWKVRQLAAALNDEEPDVVASYWVLVLAASIEDQLTLQTELEAQGRTCKPLTRR